MASYVAIVNGVGLIGAASTTSGIGSWYSGLIKPFFAPPNWLFGPVWTVLYVMIGVTGYLLSRKNSEKYKIAQGLFWWQLLLNGLWSPVFFGMRNITLGLVVIVALAMVLAKWLKVLQEIDRRLFWMMVPYFAWVSFATMLNAGFWILN